MIWSFNCFPIHDYCRKSWDIIIPHFFFPKTKKWNPHQKTSVLLPEFTYVYQKEIERAHTQGGQTDGTETRTYEQAPQRHKRQTDRQQGGQRPCLSICFCRRELFCFVFCLLSLSRTQTHAHTRSLSVCPVAVSCAWSLC